MKAALLNGVALAAAFVVGVQLAAQESPSAERCPWISNHVAKAREGMPARATEAPAESPLSKTQPPARPAPGGHATAPHPLGAAECSEGAWKDFLIPSFDSQAACESWVLENLAASVLENLPPGQSREFRFPRHETSGTTVLRSGTPLLI
ncbi:MAG TPA: hypothetical protein VKH43_00475 [Thermoanaerobaculia bacterium]|nr:hypothetical protein [Thermoanaerobaculia bacterium]